MTNRDRRGQLYIYSQDNIIKEKLPYFEGTNLLGRNPAKTSITIKDRSISQTHCKIIIKNNTIKVVDLASKNGVYLNSLENPLDPNIQVEVNGKDDVVYFAQIKCRFVADEPKKDSQEETKGISNRVHPGSKNANISGDKQNFFDQKQKNEDMKKEATTKEKNEENVTSKDNKKTKKQQIDQKQKEKQKQELLKDILTQQQQMGKQRQIQKANQQKQKKIKEMQREKEIQIEREKEKYRQKEKEKDEEIKSKKQPKKKSKKQSKQKLLEKANNTQDQIPKKPNSKEKKKVSNQKQAKNEMKKPPPQKSEPLNKKQTGKNPRKQTIEPVPNLIDQEQKKQAKQKRSESGQTKVKAVKSNKTKSVGKLDQKPNQKSKPPIARKKLAEALSETSLDHPRRSVIQKTALISGFTLTFKPSIKIIITDNWRERFDVLVMQKYARTFKLLYAICLGVPVVTINWILESQHRRGIVPFQRFFLQAPQKDLLYSSVTRARDGYKVFKDIQFYLVQTEQSFHLPLEQIKALIEAGGGSVKKQLNRKNKEVIFIVKLNHNVDDMRILRKIQDCQKIYTVELILDSCLNQEIKWQFNKVRKS